jgi:hypothetical protein
MLCDCRYSIIKEINGATVGVGRTQRSLPLKLERLMKERDKGRRYPNCHAIRYVHGHHIQFWGNEGPSDLDNVISLCSRHHYLLHAGGWKIEGNPNDRVQFIDQNGRTLDGQLPTAQPQTKHSIHTLLKYACDTS